MLGRLVLGYDRIPHIYHTRRNMQRATIRTAIGHNVGGV